MLLNRKDYAEIVSRNLRRIMFERGVSQAKMCSDLHITKSTLSSWMNGRRMPKMNSVDAMCAYLNCTRNDLMEVPVKGKIRRTAKSIRIPVLGRVAAGIPIDAITDILDYEEITEDMASTGEYFGLKIKGDSMTPRIVEGDVVIVRKQPDAESGDIVIAQINGNTATCKKLIKHKNGVNLVGFNPDFPPMFYTNEEIENLPVVIIGKVVENRQKY